MQLQQKTVTTIIADEGKVLRRISDGACPGEKLTLGYNYYEAGVLLDQPYLERPEDYEEIDAPETEAEEPAPEDHSPRLASLLRQLRRVRADINGYGLTDEQALEFAELLPVFGQDIKAGAMLTEGERFAYAGRVYRVAQDHEALEMYRPDAEGQELYVEI